MRTWNSLARAIRVSEIGPPPISVPRTRRFPGRRRASSDTVRTGDFTTALH
jgi:hypothetical protein